MLAPVSEATILHADLDAFYAAVAVRDRPSLAGRPVAVGGGVVLSCTYEARAFGVEGGMGIAEARRRCPNLLMVKGSFPDFVAESERVFAVFRRFTPLVEPLSIDEAFLETAGAGRLFGTPEHIARSIRSAVRAETGLAVSIGVARTKFLAKVASAVVKPDGLLVVEPADELRFLHALPIRRLWGVGPVTAQRLAGYGISNVADLAGVPEATLARWVGGEAARHLLALSWNRDPRPVQARPRARSVGAQSTFGRDVRDSAEHDRVLLALAQRVGRRMRAKERAGRCVTVRIRFADFETITRSVTLPAPVCTTDALYCIARALTRDVLRGEHRGLRLLGISVSAMETAPPLQLELALDGEGLGHPVTRAGSAQDLARRALDETVDRLRERYGRTAVERAALIGNASGPTLHELAEGSLDRGG